MSSYLLSRGIFAAFRQRIHSSNCPNFPGRLYLIDLPVSDRERLFIAARDALASWRVMPAARDNIYDIRFQAPYDDAPAPASSVWEQPGHARFIVTACDLLRNFKATERPHLLQQILGEGTSAAFDMAANLILSAEENGCWYDFNLNDCVFLSNMVYFVDALFYYINIVGLFDPSSSLDIAE